MPGGYRLRLLLGFAVVGITVLAVSGAVFASFFSNHQDGVERSELRATVNDFSADIARIMRRGDAGDDTGGGLVKLIRNRADAAGLIIILLNAQGRPILGAELPREWRSAQIKLDLTAADLREQHDRGEWVESRLRIDDQPHPVVARLLPAELRRRLARPGRDQPNQARANRSRILAVAFRDQQHGLEPTELIPLLSLSGLAGLGAAALLVLVLTRSPARRWASAAGFGAAAADPRTAELNAAQIQALTLAVEAMGERVASNERSMQNFLADFSHELRTPLTSIGGFVEALRDDAISDPEQRRHSLDLIRAESRRLLNMVEQLLDLSRFEAGQHRLQPSSVDISELIEHVAAVFDVRAAQRGVELRIDIDPQTPAVEADYDRLVQVLNNLVDNALRHTESGSISLTAQPVDDGVQLRVADTGEGIAPDDLARLFDRFWRSESHSGRGSGLGLAISREIVRAHAGRIEAQSTIGEGTEITVWLPIKPDP